ncbi:MAG: hypothetical protein K2Q34_05075 [Alphaproteobacteria bacterium]|nr:hypothetical protein [Silvanigrellaceae bacterium]MBY0462534.1 hypothetical protein [Alphaproteobacteria bacterium]
MKPPKFFLKIFNLFFLLALISIQYLTPLAAGEEKKDNILRLKSLCPNSLSAYLNGSPPQEEHDFFKQWKNIVKELKPILDEGGSPRIFISYAWHVSADGHSIDDESTIEEACYYDQIAIELAHILNQIAGFNVLFDNDKTLKNGIIEQGPSRYMEEIENVDVVISICTPLYYKRSTLMVNGKSTGVKEEVDKIKERFRKTSTKVFYVPLLVHASKEDFLESTLLVGQDFERMRDVIFLDMRDRSTFISNMWQVLHRLWNNLKLQWRDHPETKFNDLTQRYINILGKLLSTDDYYDERNKAHPSPNKEGLKDQHNRLRIFTTPLKNMDPLQVASLVKQEISEHQALFNASHNRDIVVFLGNTGSGKSTLINFLAEKELKTDFHDQGYELVNPNDPTAMKIGQELDSETLYPQWVQIDDLILFDLPGFNDTDGTIRNLINSAFIHQIINEATSVRFVLVAGQDEVTAARGYYIKTLFHAMKRAFMQSAVIENNSLFIMTKSDFKFQDRKRAIDFLWDKMQSPSGKSFQKQLDLWKKNDRLWHMPKPHFDDWTTQYAVTKLLLTARNNLQKKIPVRFNKENRSGLMNSILKTRPATREDIQGFNVSGFYSSEANWPLEEMFFHMMKNKIQNQRLQVFQDQWDRIQKGEEGDLIPHKIPDFTVTECDNEIKAYDELEEVQLLKEVCQDPYEKAHQDFQNQYGNWLLLLDKYVQYLKKCQPLRHLIDGHEAVYRRFINGKLIYKPNRDNEVDRIEIPFSILSSPLEGTFDLSDKSKFGDIGDKISISAGYRKEQKAENKGKVEVWIVPKFVVEKNLATTAKHLATILDKFTSPVGVFWTWGKWNNMDCYDYLTSQNFDELSNGENLYEKYARCCTWSTAAGWCQLVRRFYLQF